MIKSEFSRRAFLRAAAVAGAVPLARSARANGNDNDNDNRPLIAYAMDHLIHDLGVHSFAVNTHHCPEAYEGEFPDGAYRGCPLHFRHELVLLDTAGGIDNLRDWLPREEPFVVYNGDILTDLPLKAAAEQHTSRGDLVTMILRSRGEELRVGYDAETARVVDLRGTLRPEWTPRYQFTGIYIVSPAFLDFIQPGKIESVVLPLLEVIRTNGRVGGIVIDDGEWSDLGERKSYLAALDLLAKGFPRYADHGERDRGRIAPGAEIAADAHIDAVSSVARGARVGAGAILEESVLWPGASVAAGIRLRRTVVREGRRVEADQEDADI